MTEGRMELPGRPHPIFAAVWGVLLFAALIVGVIGIQYPMLALGVGLAILLVEGIAVAQKRQARDTLSEITTWVNRKLSKHRDPLKGWNSLVFVQAVIIGRLVYVILVGLGGMFGAVGLGVQLFAFTVSAVFAAGQHAHWLRPDLNG